MKKYKIVKDTPFHKAGTELSENEVKEIYNSDKMSEGEADSVINFWSFFEEVKKPRFTMDNLPYIFIFENRIYHLQYNGLHYHYYDSVSDWYTSYVNNFIISRPELLNKINNSVSELYIITPSKVNERT